MSLLSALDRIVERAPGPFIAPVLDADATMLVSVQDGVPYHFEVAAAEPGWWRLAPRSAKQVGTERQAYPHEYLPYLEALPRFYVIACFPLSAQTWLVVPFNASDAAQRGWSGGEPRPVHLVRGTVAPLDLVVSRSLAGTLIFDRVSDVIPSLLAGLITSSPGWNVARSIVETRRQAALEEERERLVAEHRVTVLQTTEGQIRDRLEFMGAELMDWSEQSEGYEVTWEFDGCQHTATIQRNMMLRSAGICLEGSAPTHDLSSAVQIMQTARRVHRFDLPESAWIT